MLSSLWFSLEGRRIEETATKSSIYPWKSVEEVETLQFNLKSRDQTTLWHFALSDGANFYFAWGLDELADWVIMW